MLRSKLRPTNSSSGVTAGDPELQRVQVWEDAYWRMTTSLWAEVPGFSYLEPKRHISDITALDGEEARIFGEILARVTQVLKKETGAELVYIYVFGDSVPHFHVHLAPHRTGDAKRSLEADPSECSEQRARYTNTRLPW